MPNIDLSPYNDLRGILKRKSPKKSKKRLTLKEKKFVKNILDGKTQTESAVLAGYSQLTAHSQANQLMKKEKIIKALERNGISDDFIADNLKQNIENGTANYTKATPADALKGLQIVAGLKGYMQVEKDDSSNTTNIYINELKQMNNQELDTKLSYILQEVENMK